MNRRAIIIFVAATIAGAILLVYLLLPAADNSQGYSASRPSAIAAPNERQIALAKPADGS